MLSLVKWCFNKESKTYLCTSDKAGFCSNKKYDTYTCWTCSAFAENIPDIYSRELQLNKANTSDKEASFLDLNIKVIGNNIHTSVYDKRDDFGFSIVNFPWLSGDVPRLPSYGIYISQLVRFARCCTIVRER